MGVFRENIMTDLIDRFYFEQLSEQDPADVCRRALCSYDDSDMSYTLPVWGDLYKVSPHRFSVECIKQNNERLHSYFDLFTVHYLLGAKEIEFANQWISEKDIPGGATFFRGPHEIPTDLITALFNDDIEGFKNRCQHYMGTCLDLGDAGFVFSIAPRVRVAVLYWEGDDEFPAESKLLYDQTIADHLALDIIYALAVGVCKRLGKSGA